MPSGFRSESLSGFVGIRSLTNMPKTSTLDDPNHFPTSWRDFKDPVYNVEKDRMRGRSVYSMC